MQTKQYVTTVFLEVTKVYEIIAECKKKYYRMTQQRHVIKLSHHTEILKLHVSLPSQYMKDFTMVHYDFTTS